MPDAAPLRFPGWSRERPSDHQCSSWCAPPVHAWRVTMARGASLDALRAWMETFPVRIVAIRYAEADSCVWMFGTRISLTCGMPDCCSLADRQPLVVIGEDAGWNAMLDYPDAPVRFSTESRYHG
jgi:hypothetical protein